ncbi:MAG: hypothetical protein ACI38P_06780, partial [Cellulosimicrobium funkei]
MKRLLASAAATALALGGLLVATAAPASAHTPDVTADCTTLSVKLWAYSKKSNELTVTVDGKEVESTTFERQLTRSYDLDPTQDHTWTVSVDASDG